MNIGVLHRPSLGVAALSICLAGCDGGAPPHESSQAASIEVDALGAVELTLADSATQLFRTTPPSLVDQMLVVAPYDRATGAGDVISYSLLTAAWRDLDEREVASLQGLCHLEAWPEGNVVPTSVVFVPPAWRGLPESNRFDLQAREPLGARWYALVCDYRELGLEPRGCTPTTAGVCVSRFRPDARVYLDGISVELSDRVVEVGLRFTGRVFIAASTMDVMLDDQRVQCAVRTEFVSTSEGAGVGEPEPKDQVLLSCPGAQGRPSVVRVALSSDDRAADGNGIFGLDDHSPATAEYRMERELSREATHGM